MELIYPNKEPKIALVVGTFASTAYIHLHLESWKRNYPHIQVLINDDGSHKKEELVSLCSKYKVSFHSNTYRHKWTVGDMTCYYNGLLWAQQIGADILVKMSRRFIPFYDWVPELQQLAYDTQAPTFSQQCNHFKFGFRTECVGFNVKTWINSGNLNKIGTTVSKNERMFVEAVVHDMARSLIKDSHPIFRKYHDETMKRTIHNNGYALWNIMRNTRVAKQERVLWHDVDKPVDYYKRAISYGLKYSIKDFIDPNEGGGLGDK